jgi:hypothetical protein
MPSYKTAPPAPRLTIDDGAHTYIVTVYALKTEKLGLDANANQPVVGFYLNHEICVLAGGIDCESVIKDFSVYYKDIGRPSVPLRRMIGLVLLKHIYNLLVMRAL